MKVSPQEALGDVGFLFEGGNMTMQFQIFCKTDAQVEVAVITF